jgi:hypothetical protein
MGYVTFAALIVLGVLGAANLIIARKPDAKELIAQIAPYQGWIGAISALWGAWWLVHWVLNMKFYLTYTVLGITFLANGLLLLALGLLFGVGVLKSFIKEPKAVEKLDLTVSKLSPFQSKLGIAAIVVALWTMIDWHILHF